MNMMGKEELLEKYKDERTQTENWTRVMGYYRPVRWFNIGKKSEHKQRAFFKAQEAMAKRTPRI